MFQRATVRLFAGMLFGACAGVLWGVWLHASKWPVLGKGDEVAQMESLLEAIMLGAASGFIVGSVLSAARNRMASGFAIVPVILATIYLRPGFPFLEAKALAEAQIAAAGLILIFALAAAALIPPAAKKA